MRLLSKAPTGKKKDTPAIAEAPGMRERLVNECAFLEEGQSISQLGLWYSEVVPTR